MKTAAKWTSCLAVASGLALAAGHAEAQYHPSTPPVHRHADDPRVTVPPATGLETIAPHDGAVVQLALLLDTSNSMDGLIDQAKATLWSIVGEMGWARHEGEVPQLQVALYEYGNDRVSQSMGYVRQRAPFTTDLDVIGEQLFALRTDGGSEYCGRAIRTAARSLRWWATHEEAPKDAEHAEEEKQPEGHRNAALEDQTRDAVTRGIQGGGEPADDPGRPWAHVAGPVVKVVVIAGNEPFTQGATPYQEAIAEARELGVTVHTIFCGDRAKGAGSGWEDGARLGGGVYGHIDQNESLAEPPTPYDDAVASLLSDLNGTYLAYGERGGLAAQRQASQDAMNADAGNLGQRAEARASVAYVAASWDLVDAVKRGEAELSDIPARDLPEKLRGLSPDSQRAKIEELYNERQRIQKEIRRVNAKRAAFIAEQHTEGEASSTLDETLLSALRTQLRGAGLEFMNDESE